MVCKKRKLAAFPGASLYPSTLGMCAALQSQTEVSAQLDDKQGSAKCEAGGRDHLQEALSFSFCGVSCFVGPK